MHNAISLRHDLRLSVLACARWPSDDDSRRSAGRPRLAPELQEPVQLGDDVRLRLFLCIILEDELVEGLLDSGQMHVILLEAVSRVLLQFCAVKGWRDLQQVVFNARNRRLRLDLQQDKLVWDDAHLLEG